MARAIDVQGNLTYVSCDGVSCKAFARPLEDTTTDRWLRLYEILPNGDTVIWEFCPDCATKMGMYRGRRAAP